MNYAIILFGINKVCISTYRYKSDKFETKLTYTTFSDTIMFR